MLPFEQPDVIAYSQYILDSYRHWIGKTLAKDAKALYYAPFVVVAHGVQSDPIFCYANLAAQTLWNMDWNSFTVLPSHLSAEPDAQEDRERLLVMAASQGYVDHYHGVRITADGKRFRIDDCMLWNVIDENQRKIGQAACFSHWKFL